jgi:hypothetical protein
MSMRRLALALLAATCVSALAVGAATSAKPERVPVFIEDFAVTDACPFPVGFEITAQNSYVTVFSDGRIHFSGKIFIRLTNLDQPTKSLSLNISGPALVTPTSEKLFGRGLLILFPFDAGGPTMLLTTGRVDIVRAEDGAIVEFTNRAPTKNVCAALA